MSFLALLLCSTLFLYSDLAQANYNYTVPSPTLKDKSLYQIQEISKDEYDTSVGIKEVFADAYIDENDNIQYRYFKYSEKPDIVSSAPISSGNGGEDVSGGWYTQFGTYNGKAIKLYSGEIGNVFADFVNNGSDGYGGAVYVQDASIASITGDFINNNIQGYSNAYGGAIYTNIGSEIGTINGNFIRNYIIGSRYIMGAALLNAGEINEINAKFIGNHIEATAGSLGINGGAIYNSAMFSGAVATIHNLNSDFTFNYIDSKTHAAGGAMGNTATIKNINGNFIGNYAKANTVSRGGALFNIGTIDTISANFVNNYAETSSTSKQAFGGAIYTEKDLNFTNTGKNIFFSNNYINDNRGLDFNAIFVNISNTAPTLTFNADNNGKYIINDSITGATVKNDIISNHLSQFDIYFKSSDGSSTVFLADSITNANVYIENTTFYLRNFEHNNKQTTYGDFSENGDLRSSIFLNNSTLSTHNDYIDNISVNNYTAQNNSFLHINVNQINGKWISDKIDIAGNISGQTNVVVYSLSKNENSGASVLFVNAPNDTIKSQDAFKVYRVYGSPYMWNAVYKSTENGSQWYLVGNKQYNPNQNLPTFPSAPEFTQPETEENIPEVTIPEKPIVAAEIQSYIALPSAAIEQNRSVMNNVKQKVSSNKFYAGYCWGNYDESYDGAPLKNAWISPVYHTADIDSPADINADLKGLEAGFDVQNDINHKIGIFFSYRKGDYQIGTESDKYISQYKSDIDLTSYLMGLYYRYDYRRLWAFAGIYGGKSEADIHTDDGMSANSDGSQISGDISLGYTIPINKTLIMQPELNFTISQIKLDDIHDIYAKSAVYDNLVYSEAQLGIRLEKYISTENGTAKIYLKPSVSQEFVKNNNLTVTDLGSINACDEKTIFNMELGGRYAVTDNLSLFGSASAAFADGYQAKSFTLGLSYSW